MFSSSLFFLNKRASTFLLVFIFLLFFPYQGDLFGSTLYDLTHPDDVEKVREQLSTSESQNTGRILDLKSKFELPILLELTKRILLNHQRAAEGLNE